jgi:glycosyltransferase 2 family protein
VTPGASVPDGAAHSRWRPAAAQILKLTVSVGLIWILLSRIDMAQLWAAARRASVGWLAVALAVYGLMIVVSAWRWGVLLRAQGIRLPFLTLTRSFLVATFFNNFLPSNIGGDVVRVADTAHAAGSKTLATTVVLLDRGLGLLGLVLIAAVGATLGARLSDGGPVAPLLLWAGLGGALLVAVPALMRPDAFGRLLRPLRTVHPAWVDERLARLVAALSRFGRAPGALAGCFAGAIVVQAVLVGFYLAIARSMAIPVGPVELAVIVPITLIVQMAPVSMNGFGVREATFGFYFTRLGLSLESALLVSFTGAVLIMLFSLTGAVAYLARRHRRSGDGDVTDSIEYG